VPFFVVRFLFSSSLSRQGSRSEVHQSTTTPQADHLATGILYALSLLLDEESGASYAVGQCELEVCGGYFLRSGKSGKPAKYHDDCRKRLRAKSRHLKRREPQEP
jgi:hypothetical protein